MLAVRIERMYSKDEILELYFNKVAFGAGIYAYLPRRRSTSTRSRTN